MPEPLNVHATPARLSVLRRAGVLSEDQWSEAVALANAPATNPMWRQALDRILLFTGTGLLLSGIVYFFAFNWEAIPLWLRLVGIHGMMVSAALFGWRRGVEGVSGKAALLAACVLFAVGQAVISQHYQTGADPWFLFTLCCLTTLPWTLLARFPAAWLIWLLSLSIAVATAWEQVLGLETDERLALLLATTNGCAWAATNLEVARVRGLNGAWLPRVLASATIGLLLIPALINVFEATTAGLLATLMLGVLGAALLVQASTRKADIFTLSMLAVAAIIWSTAGLSRVLFDFLDLEAMGALVIGGLVVAEVTLAAWGLRHLSRRQDQP